MLPLIINDRNKAHRRPAENEYRADAKRPTSCRGSRQSGGLKSHTPLPRLPHRDAGMSIGHYQAETDSASCLSERAIDPLMGDKPMEGHRYVKMGIGGVGGVIKVHHQRSFSSDKIPVPICAPLGSSRVTASSSKENPTPLSLPKWRLGRQDERRIFPFAFFFSRNFPGTETESRKLFPRSWKHITLHLAHCTQSREFFPCTCGWSSQTDTWK